MFVSDHWLRFGGVIALQIASQAFAQITIILQHATGVVAFDCQHYFLLLGRLPQIELIIKVAINGRLQSIAPPPVHVINRLTVNYDTPKQYLNFNRADFFEIHLNPSDMTFKPRVFHLRQTNFACYEESTGSL